MSSFSKSPAKHLRVLISCGEPSGDLYAGSLTAELRARVPSVEVFGLGGERFKEAGGHLIGQYEGLSATGFSAPLRVLPRYISMLRRLEAAAHDMRPDVFVPIDFPDFNFRLMAAVRRLGIPVVYYISPQLWAWRTGRMRTMKQHVDRVLVIFPFEEEIYRRSGVPVQFVGHPLVEMSRLEGPPRDRFLRDLGLVEDAPTVALLPGSRRNELERIIPTLADALPLIRSRVPHVQFIVACAPHMADDLYAPLLNARGTGNSEIRPPILLRDRMDDVLSTCDIAITASGTATMQCALHERPMVVVYRLSPIEYAIGRRFVKVDAVAMPNLIAGRRIVPELIQETCTAPRVAEEAVSLLTSADRHQQMREDLRQVKTKLGPPGASGRAADAILAVVRGAVSA